MTNHVDPTQTVIGPYGISEPVPIPAGQRNSNTTCYHLITAPGYHPAWQQYALVVVDLTVPRDDLPPVKLHFPGASHELLVMVLDPRAGRFTPVTLLRKIEDQVPIYLMPVNVVHQFTATDDEMRQLAWLCARAVVLGYLNPETGDAPARIREEWLQACVLTLAHMRGEEHAGHGGH